MTRQTHLIQPIPQLPVSRRGMKRWWISAILYLMACIYFGADAAFYLTVFFAIVWAWMWLAWRFPSFGYFTGVLLANVIGGFIGGLFGSRGGGYYYGPRYRRRR